MKIAIPTDEGLIVRQHFKGSCVLTTCWLSLKKPGIL
jgi:hypothetical protein